MFASPRVVAIDDDLHHLNGLVNSLHRGGVACLPIHFMGDPSVIKPCPNVRIIFADLHLINSGSDHAAQFTTLGGLLEGTIGPCGPYFILLWTQYPKQAAALEKFLDERLDGVTKPYAIIPLAKADHLDDRGRVRDEEALMARIISLTNDLPQIGALFDWETRVLRAAGDTVTSVLSLASTPDSADRTADAGRILSQLGIAAVGKEHVEDDRFRAVNEALLPILADRVASLRSVEGDDSVWRAAVASEASQPLSLEESACLNRMVHVDTAVTSGVERGNVIPLPPRLGQSFEESFGIDQITAAGKQFHCRDFVTDNERFRWVLVQTQAACDYAQSRPGPVPCYLGLELPNGRSGSLPAALWTSPALDLNGDVRLLRVSAAFPVSIGPAEFDQGKPIYRLREQILNDLIYHLHSHGARPGFLSFRA